MKDRNQFRRLVAARRVVFHESQDWSPLVTNDQRCDEIAEMVTSDHEVHVKFAGAGHMADMGSVRSKLSDALKAIVEKYNEKGIAVPWAKILSLLPQIVALIAGGGNWPALIAAILALFFPTPTPTPGA